MNYSLEDYEILKKYEDVLYTALYCQFVRAKNRTTMTDLDDVYKRVFKTNKGLIGSCSHCFYEACKKLGKLYFEDKKAYEMTEKEQNNTIEETEQEKEPKTPKKMSQYTYKSKTVKKNKTK